MSLLAALAVVGVVWWYGRQADAVDPELLLDYRPRQVTRILARDGTVIGELHTGERRTVVAYDELPPTLVDAFLAAEDADFFTHHGLDWPGIVRATVRNVTQVEAQQGASTITQQVIKNTLLDQRRSVERKSQEIVLASRVEAVLSKRQILEIYVNEIYFGEGRYGVSEAARYYFGKTLAELDLGEMATLAALPNAPGVVTCYRQVERLAARRDYVLTQMVEHGFLAPAAIAAYVGQPIVPLDREAAARVSAIGDADEFVDLARRELLRRYGEDGLARLGATVWTTVDLDLQREARATSGRTLDQLEARHGYGTHARPLSASARARLDASAPATLEPGQRLAVVIADARPHDPGRAELDATLGPHAVVIELGPLASLEREALAERFPVGHAIDVRVRADRGSDGIAHATLEPGPELAVALADVESGQLRVLLGGREFHLGGFDRALFARRQPGSSFKPVVYGAAARAGMLTPDAVLPGDEGLWRGVAEAFADSDNAAAQALFDAVGPLAVHQFARDLGLDAALRDDASLALGTSEVTPIELLTAYLTIARAGAGIEPRSITAIEIPDDLRGHAPAQLAAEPGRTRFGVEIDVAARLDRTARARGRARHRDGRPGARTPGRGQDRDHRRRPRPMVRGLHHRSRRGRLGRLRSTHQPRPQRDREQPRHRRMARRDDARQSLAASS